MSTGTPPRFPIYSELKLQVASKYSCFNFGIFYIVGGRRLLITESLSWKDTISGHPESSTCMLSKHIGKKGDQLCMQMQHIHSSHKSSYAWDDGSGAELKAPISK
jgi:hypothetical protein